MKAVTDDTIMTWGIRHKGKHMRDVPDDYLLWMWECQFGTAEILAYIKDNLDVLKNIK